MKHKFLFDTKYGIDNLESIIEKSKLDKEEFILFDSKEETNGGWLSINDFITNIDADYITYITNNVTIGEEIKSIIKENLDYSQFDVLLPLLVGYKGDEFYMKNSLFWSPIYGDNNDKHGIMESELFKVFKQTPLLLKNFEGVCLTFKKETFEQVGGFKYIGGDRLLKLVFDFMRNKKKVYTSNKIMAMMKGSDLEIFSDETLKPSHLDKWLNELLES